jgi:dienelactone hydrolase
MCDGSATGGRVLEHLDPPVAPAELTPPTRRGLRDEWRSALQLPRLLARTPRLALAPRGDGGPVVLVPGWRAPEASMAPMRAYLRYLGHDAEHWGFGTNHGNPARDGARLARRVCELAAERGRPVALVGWSLGGTVSRECARDVPEVVDRVVTYGTPAIGGPSYTIAASGYGRGTAEGIARRVEELDRERPITVPLTVIFTRRDRIVSWGACIDRTSPQARHVEVRSTHLSLGIDPDVWLTVARALGPDAA